MQMFVLSVRLVYDYVLLLYFIILFVCLLQINIFTKINQVVHM